MITSKRCTKPYPCSNHVLLEAINEAFGDDGQSKQNQLPASAALPAPMEGVEEHPNDDIMTSIKDNLITLIRECFSFVF